MKTTLMFRDFSFRAKHSIRGRSPAAGHEHWHSYNARFWFSPGQDQDGLVAGLEMMLKVFHGADLNSVTDLPETTDEALAEHFLLLLHIFGCVKVTLTNDGVRGAEAAV